MATTWLAFLWCSQRRESASGSTWRARFGALGRSPVSRRFKRFCRVIIKAKVHRKLAE
jgi:hypothetical protein